MQIRRGIVLPYAAVMGGVSYSAEATAYFAAMTSQPNAARKTVIDTLISGLISDGVWTELDWLCLLACHDRQAAWVNAINPSKLLAEAGGTVTDGVSDALTFATDLGIFGDRIAGHLNFGEAFNAAGNNYALNSASIFAYCNQGGATLGTQPHMGSTSASTLARLAPRNNGSSQFSVNDASGTEALAANTGTRLGNRIISRESSSIKRGYVSQTQTANSTTASSSVPAGNATALRDNTTYCEDRLTIIGFGGGLTQTQANALDSRLSTYLAAIGTS